MSRLNCDAIVVGAGIAGATVASKLCKAGWSVIVLEARDRVGGRAYSRPFKGDAPDGLMEFGGSWITPWHHRIRGLAKTYGLTLRPREPITRRVWYRDGELFDDGPTDQRDRAAHERVIARVAMDAVLLGQGMTTDENDYPLIDVTFADYLHRLNAPQATRELFSAWWVVSGNGDHNWVSAAEFLSSCIYGGGVADNMVDVWVETVSPGMAVLAERMITTSGADLQLQSPVSRVVDHGDAVTVYSGKRGVTAKAVVMALGVNQLSAVEFEPVLTPLKQITIEIGHGGKAIKIWAKVRGVDVGTFVTGSGSGIELAFAERQAPDGTVMVVGFGIAQKGVDPDSSDWVESEIGKFFPNAGVLAHDWHDWNSDQYARGAWVAYPVGTGTDFSAEAWAPEGRIAFAGSDIAREMSGWFEAAVISGEEAAAAIEKML